MFHCKNHLMSELFARCPPSCLFQSQLPPSASSSFITAPLCCWHYSIRSEGQRDSLRPGSRSVTKSHIQPPFLKKQQSCGRWEAVGACQICSMFVYFCAGDRYVVVDCGGGTVDLTVHQIRLPEGHLKELYKASGKRTCNLFSLSWGYSMFLSDLKS